MKDFDVIGLGALNVDHFYRVGRILEDGESVTQSAALYPGGSAANTIHGLVRLGARTGFVGVVGSDADGRLLLRAFQRADVDTSQVRVKLGARTGSVLCLSDELSRRALYVTPGANSLLTTEDIDLSYVESARILHVATFVDDRQFEITAALVQKLTPAVSLSFSPGTLYAERGLKSLSPILKRTDILFMNLQELRRLTGRQLRAGVHTLLKEGCRTVVVTLGGGSKVGRVDAVCYIRTRDNEQLVESLPQKTVRRVDTTGAGDAFAAGYLFGVLKAKSADVCGRLGYLVALSAVSKMGARSGLPTLGQLLKRYQSIYGESL